MAIACLVGYMLPASAAVTPAESEILKKTIGCDGQKPVCIILQNGGASPKRNVWDDDFEAMGEIIGREHALNPKVEVQVAGECSSACVSTLMVKHRAAVCVMKTAKIYFHQRRAYSKTADGWVYTGRHEPHNYDDFPALKKWLAADGGERDTDSLEDANKLEGSVAIALGLWRECKQNPKVTFSR